MTQRVLGVQGEGQSHNLPGEQVTVGPRSGLTVT